MKPDATLKSRSRSLLVLNVNKTIKILQPVKLFIDHRWFLFDRLGFHKPPYISVNHLHLHVLAPVAQISQYMSHKFIPGKDRFVTVSARNRLILISVKLL